LYPGIGINVNRALLFKVKCPDVVKPGNVIFVLVRKNNCVQVLYVGPQHLIPEVRPRVDHYNFTTFFK
jgi:hypothetical protein